jgi:hypothetical protein
MVVGKLYKFYGQFECGDVVIGKFEGIDEYTGFLKFSKIAKQKDCNPYARRDTISKIAQSMNGGNAVGCMSNFERQATAVYEKFANGGALPKELVHHKESTYSIDKASQFTEMKNYFKEA